jgi:hypothetical protein
MFEMFELIISEVFVASEVVSLILTVQRYGVFSRVPNIFAIFLFVDSDRGEKGRQTGRKGRGFVA